MKKRNFYTFLLAVILVCTSVPIFPSGAEVPKVTDNEKIRAVSENNLSIQANRKKVKTKQYTISKLAGIYSAPIKIKVKVKKGYKVYYSLNGKFKAKRVIKSGKKKTITIAKTKTLQLYAVKKTKKFTTKKLKKKAIKKAKKYTYTINSTNITPTPTPVPTPTPTPAPTPEDSDNIVNTYTIIFNTNGGSAVASQTVNSGSKAMIPTAPTREGYTFVGWYTNANCTTAYNFNTLVTNNIILYAKWEQNVYTISFETNGGTEIQNQAVYSFGNVIKPEDPTKEGFVFSGWYTDSRLTEEYDFTNVVTNNLTLYASWDAIEVVIALNQNTEDTEEGHRIISGNITSNIDIQQVTYTLTSKNKNEAGNIEVDENYSFSVNVLLEGGSNTFTVCVSTVDGSVIEKSIEMQYDSGEIVDYNDTGEVYDPEDPRVVTKTETNEGISTTFVTNVLNIFFSEDTSFEDRVSFVENILGGSVAGYLNTVNMMQAWLPEQLTSIEGYSGELSLSNITEDDLTAYATAVNQNYDNVEDAYIDYVYDNGFEVTTNDPWNESGDSSGNNDWWSKYVNFPDAWEYDSYYNIDYFSQITVGVVDAGFRDSHEELSGKVSVISEEDSQSSHGTHVSGIIAATADNSVGLAGGTYNNASIMAYDASSSSNNDSFASTQIYAGLTKTVEANAKVINFSLGSAGTVNNPNNKSNSTINREGATSSRYIGNLLANQYDFIVVQSAGNAGIDSINNGTFAAINSNNCVSVGDISTDDVMSRVIIVSSIDSSGQMAASSCGGNAGTNAIAAPGVDIFSCGAESDSAYTHMSGTSMAAPVVTAACSLVWSVNENLDGAEVSGLILNNTNGTASTNNSSSTTGGMGILDVQAAVESAIETLPTHYGYTVNAVNGENITASVIVHRGSINGEILGSEEVYETDETGKFVLPKLPTGSYTLEIYAENYIPTSLSFGKLSVTNENDNTINLGTVGLTPVMDEGEYRIVLRWTGEPSDLDSHLVATTIEGNYYHVYYSDEEPYPGYANLDWDDTYYEGPETITITNFDSLRNVRYAVHNYTNRYDSSSNVLSNSGAYIEVYKGSTLLRTFNVPTNTGGTEWDVFAFDANGNIIPTNTMKYCSEPYEVLSDGSLRGIVPFSARRDTRKDYEKDR